MPKRSSSERREPAFQDLFEGGLSKSERTRIEIARAAIENYATVGVEQTNFDRVARSCGVTRPLVQHYFGTREGLFTFVVKYVRSHARAFGRERMAPARSATRQSADAELRTFLEACLDWVELHPAHAKVWLLLQYYASFDPELRELNTEITNALHQGISALLMRTRRSSHADLAGLVTAARMLQHFLSGALLSRMTESRPAPQAEFRREVIRKCLELAEA